jgi:hypothetical protein
MNATQNTLRVVLLLSFAVSGAACSATTGASRGWCFDARFDRADALDRIAIRSNGAGDMRFAVAHR